MKIFRDLANLFRQKPYRLATSGYDRFGQGAKRILPASIAVVLVGSLGLHFLLQGHAATGNAPTTGTQICNQSVLDSPYTYNGTAGTYTAGNEPSGLPTFGSAGTDFPSATSIIVVPTGDNTAAAGTGTYQVNNAIVYFEPGTHDLTSILYAGHDSVYIGGYNISAGKAVINGVDGATGGTGTGGSDFAVSQASSGDNVYNTWEYLTIENYTSSENSAVMGNVNGGGWDIGDTYSYDTIGPNEYGYAGSSVAPSTGQDNGGGYAVNMGSNTTASYDCFVQNAQGAFNGGGVNITINHNEISQNGLGEYPDDGNNPKGCGCSGGGKLFNSTNPTVDYNYVHDNYNAGIWLDFDNTGADISYNYISSNWSEGIFYEASYNANISDNTLVGNGWASDGTWPTGGAYQCYNNISCTNGFGPSTGAGGGNPYAAINLSNSGGNSNLTTVAIPASVTMPGCSSNCTVTSRYSGQILIQDNVLTNNFGGVKVYTDTNRYPDNIDYDSACSVPLGSGANGQQANNMTYYRQTKVLEVNGDATVSGSSVTTSSGAQTLCDDYGAAISAETDAGQTHTVQAPSVGMAVYDQNANAFLGTITAVTSANSFTLSGSPGNRSSASLLISAYGGCGPADYFGGDPGVASGQPSANYWDNCIWGSHNVTVSGNTFSLDASAVTGCNTTNMCGYMTNEAFDAGVPQLVTYWQNYTGIVAKVTGGLNNVWSNNTYTWNGSGPPSAWQFWAGDQGNHVTQAAWQASPYGQDAGSTFNAGNATPPPSTPNSVSATANSPTSVTVTWSASTDNGGPGLAGYYILRNGMQVGSANASATSYTDTLASPNTQYGYSVEAYDTASPANVSAASAVSTITTPASAQAPSTSITSVSNNAVIFGGSVAVNTTATPSGGNTISQVQLLLNGAAVQTLTSAPYDFTLNTLGYKDGDYTLSLKATDNQNNIGTSSETIAISNGDFNGDKTVGISDLSIMAAHWGVQSGATYSQGDINGDGKVNISDLSILASNWGSSW